MTRRAALPLVRIVQTTKKLQIWTKKLDGCRPNFLAHTRRMNKITKEQYEAYKEPTVIDKKTKVRRNKQYREMTEKEKAYHTAFFNYWLRNIQPYQFEK